MWSQFAEHRNIITLLRKCSPCIRPYLKQNFVEHSTKPASSQKPFRVLNGDVDTSTDEYGQNAAWSYSLAQQFKQMTGVTTSGGGPKAMDRHVKLNKKLLAWDRLRLLFDDYSSVLEIGKLAGLMMEYGDIPRAGAIAAIGKINGVHCMVTASDATVKGGTLFPISVKKQLRMQDVSMQSRLPYVFVIDSGGAFLPLQAEVFQPGGRTFYNEAILNSMNIPQLSVVVGSCTAGAAYIPTMVQESIIVDKIGTIFLAGPPLVKAALGESVSPEELGGATLHCSVSGYTDHFAETEAEAYEVARDSVLTFNVQLPAIPECFDEPLYSMKELDGIIPSKNQHTLDIHKVLARLIDGSRFQEFKANYGKGLVTGFGYLQGYMVGIVANNGPMTERAALKGSHFVQLCDQRNVPLIFLQNTWPDDHSITTEDESVEHGARIRGEAKLMSAVACAKIPKITVIIGNSLGIGNYSMCGRAFEPNFLFSWPNAQICIDEPSKVISTLLESVDDSDKEQSIEIRKEITQKSSAFFAASRMLIDDVILPQDTRKILGQCLEIVNQNIRKEETRYSVMRM